MKYKNQTEGVNNKIGKRGFSNQKIKGAYKDIAGSLVRFNKPLKELDYGTLAE